MHTVYLNQALGLKERKQTVKKLCECIKKSGIKFDSIAFTGMSGALIAPLVAYKLKKNLVMVRKPSDENHSNMTVEAENVGNRYIIIDDLIFSGKTIINLVKTMDKNPQFDIMVPVAVFTYRTPEDDRNRDSYVRDKIDREIGHTLTYQNCNTDKVYFNLDGPTY